MLMAATSEGAMPASATACFTATPSPCSATHRGTARAAVRHTSTDLRARAAARGHGSKAACCSRKHSSLQTAHLPPVCRVLLRPGGVREGGGVAARGEGQRAALEVKHARPDALCTQQKG